MLRSLNLRVLLLLLLAALPATAGTAWSAPDFLKLLQHRRPPRALELRRDDHLQHQLETAVNELGLDRLVQAGRFGVALVDLSAPGAPRLAEINGGNMMYAASVPKVAVLYAAFQAWREGRVELDDAFRQTLTDMIRVSSNDAASAAIQRLGFGYINSLLWQSGLYDPAEGGGLWLGKAYGGDDDTWHRDPLYNISHGATPVAVARLLTAIAEGRLIDAEASRQMKEILGDPGLHHKFVRGLDDRPGARIFRKSGTWRQWHGDAALVERDDKRYVAVALCEDPGGSELLEKLIVALDDCVCPPPQAVASLVH